MPTPASHSITPMFLFDDNKALWTEDFTLSLEDFDKSLLYQPSNTLSMHAPSTTCPILEQGEAFFYACTFSEQPDDFYGLINTKKDCPINWEEYLNLRIAAPQPEKAAQSYTCPQCDKQFPTKYRMVSHLTVHSTEKKFNCEICNKKFARSHDLRRHVRGHGKKLELSCFVCGKTFSRKDALKRHMETFCN